MKNKRKTMEQLIRNNMIENNLIGSEYILKITNENENGSLDFYIRPNNRDGETRDFTISGNKIKHNYKVRY